MSGAESGAVQKLNLNQRKPQALIVRASSAAVNVSGSKDSGYGIYMDINYVNKTHERGVSIKFDVGTYDWKTKRYLLERPTAIKSIELHCMLRDHTGIAWFKDVLVMATHDFVCACGESEMVLAGSDKICGPCPEHTACVHGESFIWPTSAEPT